MDNGSSIWMPPQASTVAKSVDDLFDFILWLNIISFAMIAIGTVYFAWKYRRKTPDQLATAQIPHNTIAELSWTIIPGILVMWVFVWGFQVFLDLHMAPADSLEYRVKASQRKWEITEPDGCYTPGALHVPAGKPIKLLMHSEDVLHSFFVKDFRIKQDVIPGRYASVWFQADKPGQHHIFCTEYCGTSHSDMLATVYVHTAEEMAKKDETWCKSEPTVERGQMLYTSLCSACHSNDGRRIVGPTFKGLYGRDEKLTTGETVNVNENYIVESIRDPQAKIVDGYPPAMPAFPQLKTGDIDALINYMKTLK